MPTKQTTRRGFIALSSAVALAGVTSQTAVAQEVERDSYTIMDGTEYETEVFVIDAPESGPTVMVVAGLHGTEPSGAVAAENLLGWTPEAGRLVIIPRGNQPALEANTRDGPHGNLNRQFPVGEEPSVDIANAIWEVVEEHQPDTLLDLHRSQGIYGVDEDTYGQAIFYSTENNEAARAEAAAAHLNENYVPDSLPDHDFVTQALQYTPGMLVTKAASDLGVHSFLFEVTERDIDFETQVEWTEAGALHLISSTEGLEDDEPPADDDEDGEDGEDDEDGDDGPAVGVDAQIEVDAQTIGLDDFALATFDGGSSSAAAEIESYEWDTTGDGEFDMTGRTVRTVVSLTEPTTISLRVTDANGCSDTQTITLRP